MKHFMFTFIAVFAMASSPLFAQQTSEIKTDTIKVNGVCGMCKSRIKKNVKIDGASEATLSKETGQLLVSYNPNKITNDEIHRKIAAAGHDTEKYKSEDKVYEKLRGCCITIRTNNYNQYESL